MSFPTNLISLAAGSLSCSPQDRSSRGSPCRVIGSAPRQAGPLPAPLGGALIRQGCGYNLKSREQGSCSSQQVQWAVGVAGQAAFICMSCIKNATR